MGLGVYELLEESAFWLGGSVLMGAGPPPPVEARLCRSGSAKPLWEETYFVLWVRKELTDFPAQERDRRDVQLRKVLRKLFSDLEAIPDFPRVIKPPGAPPGSPPATAAAPAPRPPG